MKSTWLGSIFLATALSVAMVGCVKDEEDDVEPTNTTTNPPAEGGIGGNATLKVIPQHDGVDIDSCFIYLAYNTLDTTRSYNDSVLCSWVNGRPTAVFTNLKPGNYFIGGKGWDLVKSQKVAGVRAFTLDKDFTVYNVELPVGQ
jgi:hypothetical protein